MICRSATMGDDSNFTVADNGVASFPVGPPTFTSTPAYPNVGSTSYSTTSGVGLTTSTTPSEALSKFDSWLDTFLLDAPPSLTAGSSTTAVEYIQVSWTNPTQKKLAFASAYVPDITTISADVKLSSASDWSNAWTVTLESVNNAVPTVTTFRIMLDYNGTSSLSNGLYTMYAGSNVSQRVTQSTQYDIRVYAGNYATSVGSRSIRYVTFTQLSTLSAGSPSAPLNVSAGSTTTTGATVSWTIPADPDTLTSATPYISQYEVNLAATSGVRYPTYLTNQTTPQYTATATGTNATTSLSVTLNPGTTYSTTVQAKNALNSSFGSASSPAVTFTTSLPTAPSWPTTSMSYQNTYNYGSGANGYALDGTTAKNNIFKYSSVVSGAVISVSKTNFRLNYTAGDTSSSIGTVAAYAGVTGSELMAYVTTVGFGQTFTSPTYADNNSVRCYVTGEGDSYSGSSSGFYKQAIAYVQAINPSTYYRASNSSYSMYMKFNPTGGSTVTTNSLTFCIDELASNPSIVASAITALSSNTTYITGVPTFTNATTFSFQTTIANLAYQFLRSDLKHFDAVIQTSGGTVLSSTLSVTKSNINGSSHSYYTAPSQSYNTSTTKHNTTGATLSVNPGNIQFNDFTITLSSSANNQFDEAVRILVTPYNLQATGSASSSSGITSTSTGTSTPLRIDTNSIAQLATQTATATIMQSGSGQFPTSGYTTALDHTASIVSQSQLQLVNGRWSTPSVGDGYKNYSAFYFPESLSQPDYSSSNISSTGYRYLCLQFANLSSNTYDAVNIQFTCGGLTLTPSSDSANFQLYMKIVGATTTPWVCCTTAISAAGYGAISADGQGVMNNNSTYTYISGSTAKIQCYVPSATLASATIYLRFGLDMTASQYISNVQCTSV